MTTDIRYVTISLFEVDNRELKEPIVAQMQYDATDDALAYDSHKVCIAVGDDISCGTITLPVSILNQAMTMIMSASVQRKTGGLVGFEKPSIIKPN